jgi:transcriptional antiterminator NusG
VVYGERSLEFREEDRRADPRGGASQNDLEDEIEEVLVPTEEVIEVRRGKKVTTERRFMPGYVLVRMEMTDRAIT